MDIEYDLGEVKFEVINAEIERPKVECDCKACKKKKIKESKESGGFFGRFKKNKSEKEDQGPQPGM